MTPHAPVITGRQAASVARNAGFTLDHKTGSHEVFYRESDRRRVVIPVHAGKNLKPKTLASIVRDMGLTMDEFRSLL